MTRNEKRFGVIGTIGNCSDLIAAPRRNPTHSYHIRQREHSHAEQKEIAIRYDREFAIDAAHAAIVRDPETIVTVVKKPILTEAA